MTVRTRQGSVVLWGTRVNDFQAGGLIDRDDAPVRLERVGGRRIASQPRRDVQLDSQALAPARARELAKALLSAADYAEGGDLDVA